MKGRIRYDQTSQKQRRQRQVGIITDISHGMCFDVDKNSDNNEAFVCIGDLLRHYRSCVLLTFLLFNDKITINLHEMCF